MKNPWNLPDGTKFVGSHGQEFEYCYDKCYEKWMLYNPWNDSLYEPDQSYSTERNQFHVVDRWPRYDEGR